MIHPTCAHARHPDSPRSGEMYDLPSPVDLAALLQEITAHRIALGKAGDAASCLNDVLQGARRLNDDEFAVGVPALRALLGLIGDEFKRHKDAAMASALKMQGAMP